MNSIGTAYCPHRVEGHDAFIAAVSQRGYRLRDEWLNIGKRMQIAFEPEYSLTELHGVLFRRALIQDKSVPPRTTGWRHAKHGQHVQ